MCQLNCRQKDWQTGVHPFLYFTDINSIWWNLKARISKIKIMSSLRLLRWRIIYPIVSEIWPMGGRPAWCHIPGRKKCFDSLARTHWKYVKSKPSNQSNVESGVVAIAVYCIEPEIDCTQFRSNVNGSRKPSFRSYWILLNHKIHLFIAHHFRQSDLTGSERILQKIDFKFWKYGKHT